MILLANPEVTLHGAVSDSSSGESDGDPSHPPPSGVHVGAWSGFEVASRELLAQRELLTRVDRKFVTSVKKVTSFLRGLRDDYHILVAGESGWARYETLYFDTPELVAFHEHVRGRRPRYKVRIRHHVDRGRSFLEIKCKTNAEKTEKARRDRPFRDVTLTEDDRDFIRNNSGLPADSLAAAVWTNFRRATFVGVHTNERITVDVGLSFMKDGSPEHGVSFGIIELKQPRIMHNTPAAQLVRGLGVREQSVSKYCAGVATVHEGAKPRARLTVSRKLTRMKL